MTLVQEMEAAVVDVQLAVGGAGGGPGGGGGGGGGREQEQVPWEEQGL